MLVVNPKQRIEWEALFKHRINHYMDDKIKQDLQDTMKDQNLSMSISRFYIKNNKVINHPVEINKKKELNQFTVEMAKKNSHNEQ